MLTRSTRAAAGLALVVAAGLLALPACDKKKETGGGNGTDNAPPAGTPNPPGGTPKQPVEPGMPSPPGPGPHLTYNRGTAQTSVNNLKQIGFAFHNYFSSYNSLPHDIADAKGKAGLSWRVAILPYIEHDGLYRQFKLNEPWNSAHNKKLIAQMPKIYAPPGVTTNGWTYYRSFSGQGAIMPPPGKGVPGQAFRGLSLSNISDGTANTLMVAEANEPVIWTKPDDLPFTPGKPPKLGGAVFGDGFHATFGDGSVRFLRSSNIDTKTLSNLIQTNDGQIVNID
jgi:hypothetical protein